MSYRRSFIFSGATAEYTGGSPTFLPERFLLCLLRRRIPAGDETLGGAAAHAMLVETAC